MRDTSTGKIRIRELLSNSAFHLLVLAILSGMLLFSNLHKGGLGGYDDAIFAYESRQMVTTSDWWTILRNGELHFDYLPLFYWMEAVSMSVFGFTDLAAKVPPALCGMVLILVTYFISKELTGDTFFAIVSAWVLMLTQYFMKYATHAMSDVPFAMFVAIALLFYLKGRENRKFLLVFGLAVGCAVLTRTVLGVLPLAIAFAHVVITRRFEILRSKEFAGGVSIAIALPAAVYLTYYSMFGQAFLEGHFSFIWSKTIADTGRTFSTFLLGLFEYPFLLFKMYQPWFLFALVGLVWQIKKIATERDSTSIFLVLWVVAVILPFSIASAKVLRYIMPIFPALAILAAFPLSALIRRYIKPEYRKAAFAGLCLIVLTIPLFSAPRLRAKGVVGIAPLVISNSEPGTRVVLYTGGVLHHDILNQMIWYTSRYYHHIADEKELLEKLKTADGTVFVVDRPSFESAIRPSASGVEILGATDEYVCFRVSRYIPAP